MHDDSTNLCTIRSALSVLPKSVREEYAGAAWEHLQKVADRTPAEQQKAIANHVQYLYRRDMKSTAPGLPADIADDAAADPARTAELKEEAARVLAKLNPLDRTIVIMLAASCTYRDIADEVNLSPSGVHRRIQAIRERAGGGQ